MSGGPKTTTNAKTTQEQEQEAKTKVDMNNVGTSSGTTTGTSNINTFGNEFATNTGSTATTGQLNPYAALLPGLQSLTGMINNFSPGTGLTEGENSAYAGLKDASQYGIGDLQSLSQGLLGGYGFGAGNQGVDESYNDLKSAFSPFLQGGLDPSENPGTQQLITQLRNSAMNDTHDMWSRAGRSFSPGEAGAIAKNTTEATAPILFNQYNQNVQDRFNAGNSLFNAAGNRSQLLDSSRSGALGGALAAPGLIGGIGQQLMTPYNVSLDQAQKERGLPYEGLGQFSDLLLPIAQAFGQQTGTGTNTGTATGSQTGGQTGLTSGTSNLDTTQHQFGKTTMKGDMSGSGTSNQVQQQQSDPFMTALGGGLGLLGLGLSPMTGGLSGTVAGNLFGGLFG